MPCDAVDVPEIRLDVRLLRPGALVAGVAAGRCVLVREVSEPGSGDAWIAALDAGLPVPRVREARCGERHVLAAAATAGRALSPAVGGPAIAQALALGVALAGHGISVSRLGPGDLQVCDGVLAVRAPVAGLSAGGDGEAAAFVSMVAAACRPEPAAEVPRRRRVVPAAVVALAVLAAAVTLVPWPAATGSSAPPAAAAVPVPEIVVPAADLAADLRPPAARVRTPAIRVKRPEKHRAVTPPAAKTPIRVRPPRPVKRRSVQERDDDIPVAGGDVDPLPVL